MRPGHIWRSKRAWFLCLIAAAVLAAIAAPAVFADSLSISGSMEGNISIANGDHVAAGYSFTIPGSHPDVQVLVANAVVSFTGTCSNGSPDNALTIPLRAGDPSGNPYLVPAGSSAWFPSNDEGAAESFQGSVVAQVCGGTGTLNVGKGATFSADIQASPTQYKINFRFHYRDPNAKGMGNVDCSVGSHPASVCGASWSGTQSVLPDAISPAKPTLSSSAAGRVNQRAIRHHARHSHRRLRTLGQSTSDTATLSGGRSPTGNITFALYGPNDPTCSGAPVFTSTASVSGNGDYTSASFTPTAAGIHRWRVTYSGDTNNAAAGPTPCGLDTETVNVQKAQPSLSSTASGVKRRIRHRHRRSTLRISRTLGVPIYDTAHLSGGVAPTGSITFHLYAPGDTSCNSPVFTSTVTVAGNANYDSATYVPNQAGTYRWVVSYSGDSNNASAGPTTCGDPTETVSVQQDQPSLASSASQAVDLGGTIHDTAHLSGGTRPTGSISFKLYGPDDATCSGSAAFTSSTPVAGNGDYASDSFTPSQAGAYRWIASYSGDSNNHPAGPTTCSDAAEAVVVRQPGVPPAQPALSSTASGATVAGSPITDTAHLSGGNDPTGSITFELYSPNDTGCSRAPAFTTATSVTGNGDYTSAPFTPTAPGTYRWRALYSGDAGNAGAGPTACADSAEAVFVDKASPGFGTTATQNAALGGAISDTAHLSGGSAPAGTITFRLYGPGNGDCSGSPVFHAEITIPGPGSYTSPSFTPMHAGSYHWIADYSGDANNNSAGPTACGASGENTMIAQAQPSIFSLASGASLRRLANAGGAAATGGRIRPRRRVVGRRFRAAGLPIYDTVHLGGGVNPSGFISFSLYGPNDATCSGPAVFVTETTVSSGNGDYTSESFVPTVAGTYRWVTSYSGDNDNAPAGPTACGDPAEAVTVTLPAQPSLSSSASGAVTLGGGVHDTAHLSGGVTPTGTIEFRLFGPGDDTCTGTPVFTSTVDVSGNGDYDSAGFTPADPGAYRWVVRYSGDSGNQAAGPTACAENSELVDVRTPDVIPLETALSSTASAGSASRGTPIYDVAHLSGGSTPTGAISFSLHGPDDPTCTRTPAFTSQMAVSGAGSYASAPFVVVQPGTYTWVASYSGDTAHLAAGPTTCGDPAETVTVSATPASNPNPDANPPGPVTHPPRRPPKPHKPPPPGKPSFTG